jgi:hypothetical protein
LTKILPDPIDLLHATVKDGINALLDVRGNDDWRDYVLSSASALNFTIKAKNAGTPRIGT